MNDFHLNTISVKDVLQTLQSFKKNNPGKDMDSALCFASDLTGLSVDFLLEAVSKGPDIDFEKLKLKDYDRDGVPFVLTFSYEVSHKERKEFVSSFGYKGHLCDKIDFSLGLLTETEFPLTATFIFKDGQERSVNVCDASKCLKDFLAALDRESTDLNKEAMVQLAAFTEAVMPEVYQRLFSQFDPRVDQMKPALATLICGAQSKKSPATDSVSVEPDLKHER